MDNTELTNHLKELSGTNVRQCMKCGKCSGRCPMFDKMDVKPHQFVSYLAEGKIDKLQNSKSLWYCLSCMECVERCPRGVAPAAVIEAIRESVIRPQGGNRLQPEEVPELLNEEVPQQLIVGAYRKYNH